MGDYTMKDYVHNQIKQALMSGQRLGPSDINACRFYGVDLPALEREVNETLKENAANG